MSQHPVPQPTAESWEDEGGRLRSLPDAEMLGVTRVVTEAFTVGGYAYANLADAVAQARRMHKQSVVRDAQ